MALNTVFQLRALKLDHVLFLSDSQKSCRRLATADPKLACVWSSRIPRTRPVHYGVCVRMFWAAAVRLRQRVVPPDRVGWPVGRGDGSTAAAVVLVDPA